MGDFRPNLAVLRRNVAWVELLAAWEGADLAVRLDFELALPAGHAPLLQGMIAGVLFGAAGAERRPGDLDLAAALVRAQPRTTLTPDGKSLDRLGFAMVRHGRPGADGDESLIIGHRRSPSPRKCASCLSLPMP